jgi:hypothetical protein
MWHDTLKLIKRTLGRCGIECAFGDGGRAQMQMALDNFNYRRAPTLRQYTLPSQTCLAFFAMLALASPLLSTARF